MNAIDSQKHEDRLGYLLAEAPAVIYSCKIVGDKDFQDIFVSPAVKRMSGFDPEAFQRDASFWEKHIHPEDVERVFSELPALFENGTHFLEYRFRRKDGDYLWVYHEMNLVRRAEDGACEVVGSILDMTRSRRAREERFRARKLKATGKMAGGVAHDLNNLLSVIVGNIELAQAEIHAEGPARHALSQAMSACLKTRRLARKFITFSTGGYPIKEKTDVRSMLEELVSFFTDKSDVVVIELSAVDDLWPVLADRDQLEQALANVIENAVEAMPDGGTARVSARNVRPGEPETRAAFRGKPSRRKEGKVSREGGCVMITISDQGKGMLPEELGCVFDPYYSTKERGAQKGMGLGLALTHSIIQRHGGAIDVESQAGVGTSATICLPGILEDCVSEKKRGGGSGNAGRRILVMDDEPMLRKLIAQMLVRLGYDTEVAGRGEEALERYRQALESGRLFDAVILDLLVLDGMGGMETFQALRKLDRGIKAIVSSGCAGDPVMDDCFQWGFCGKIPKPYRMRDLERTLNEVFSET